MWRRRITIDDRAITDGSGITLRQSLFPNFLVTILFFLWGFAYGLLDTLNSHFQDELNITASMSSGLSAAYFGAYFLCPLTVSGWILRRFGFRVTFMTGLCVMTIGCLLFWPSGVKASFGGFCGSMFVVGAGLSTLETGADNFLAICGPPRYSEIRLNLAQGIQGVGTFVAPLLASRVFFANTVDTQQGLKNVQWVYLGVACFVALLVPLFYIAPMPEVTDADMGLQERDISETDVGPFRKQYNLFLGVWSEFCYTGAQVAVANYFINFAEEAGYSAAKSSDLLAVGQGLYTFMRFVSSGLITVGVKPRYILATYLGLCFIFGVAATTTSGPTSVAMLILVLCFESACFATIFTLALRGLGQHTKRGGSMLVAAISGGAAIPPMTGAVATHTGNFHKAMAIPTAFYVLAWIFPIYANTVSRKLLDGHRTTDVNVLGEKKVVDGHDGVEVELRTEDGKGGTERVENVGAA
ncbi:glucose/galactose transporter [Aspergillus neoniger CBS 115656]|uniref:Glucose/galactose transporter n=1 Tax=Aspergillus neoniger (strain CBS 115656) TaxID=1448310 RepID=A0A318Y748_ASPNB|nr:glucose/galactose transporter [Aspergillus neoniger CBS 115656]PYH30126.1 glucose/galactose transporter [Aspergillus neoniger CBS 115656]